MPYLNRIRGVRESHEFYKAFNDDPDINFRCRVCGLTWKRKPRHGKCAGVRVFLDWSKVPPGVVSKTAMYWDHKRKLPDDALPAALVVNDKGSFTPLYSIEQGNPDYAGKRK